MPSPENVTAASFGRVSVVMMARAALAPPLTTESSRAARGMPVANGSSGRCSPITPVEATSTSAGAQPRTSLAMAAVSRAAASPRSPVAAFALPEFTTTACAMP